MVAFGHLESALGSRGRQGRYAPLRGASRWARERAEGGRIRHVPLTQRLAAALQAGRHLRGPRVLCDDEGKPPTQKAVQVMIRRVARRAHVKPGVHILRHTFCSHLAMRGAPARAIQELAGHQDLGTTQRYMHLRPAAPDAAIRLLDGAETRGGIVEESSSRPPSRYALRWTTFACRWTASCGLPTEARSLSGERRLVEAPGVAPGSENTCTQESTMRIHP